MKKEPETPPPAAATTTTTAAPAVAAVPPPKQPDTAAVAAPAVAAAPTVAVAETPTEAKAVAPPPVNNKSGKFATMTPVAAPAVAAAPTVAVAETPTEAKAVAVAVAPPKPTQTQPETPTAEPVANNNVATLEHGENPEIENQEFKFDPVKMVEEMRPGYGKDIATVDLEEEKEINEIISNYPGAKTPCDVGRVNLDDYDRIVKIQENAENKRGKLVDEYCGPLPKKEVSAAPEKSTAAASASANAPVEGAAQKPATTDKAGKLAPRTSDPTEMKADGKKRKEQEIEEAKVKPQPGPTTEQKEEPKEKSAPANGMADLINKTSAKIYDKAIKGLREDKTAQFIGRQINAVTGGVTNKLSDAKDFTKKLAGGALHTAANAVTPSMFKSADTAKQPGAAAINEAKAINNKAAKTAANEAKHVDNAEVQSPMHHHRQ